MSHAPSAPDQEAEPDTQVHITCLCGAVHTPLAPLLSSSFSTSSSTTSAAGGILPLATELCHCDTCRHTSGALSACLAMLGTTGPPEATLARCTAYASSARVTRYFCRTCGAAVFVRGTSGPDYDVMWFVWTGGVEGAPPGVEATRLAMQVFVDDTRDAGLLGRQVEVWGRGDGGGAVAAAADADAESKSKTLPLGTIYWGHWDGEPLDTPAVVGTVATLRRETQSKLRVLESMSPSEDDRLQARCHCGGVEFAVLRPQRAAGVAEGMRPLLRRAGTAYRANLCVCRSCRLATGHPLQPWTYVSPNCIVGVDGQPLDLGAQGQLARLPGLQAYASSKGVRRSFCRTCGATVFFECEERPWCVDVSVGILRSEVGALAEDWVEWDWEHVSHPKEARETGLVESLTGVTGSHA